MSPITGHAQSFGAVETPILTVNSEALFEQSAFGKRVSEEIEAAQSVLLAENRKIQAELTAEERELANKRPNMAPEDFRAVADAFDARVKQIRAEQDDKALQIGLKRDREQAVFINAARPILGQLMSEHGASVIVEQRSVLMSDSAIDVTRVAIERLNAELGDGAGLAPKD
ncbi:OmpH family outer membrane protein [Shimia biformata]|uniref:OmpH family outer membrane protein n=1 Tax=Shimia biformata TaxID=1294299 RepID=UPI001950C55B|nr:OmpH family outer membrane protein [Shimia biformata]